MWLREPFRHTEAALRFFVRMLQTAYDSLASKDEVKSMYIALCTQNRWVDTTDLPFYIHISPCVISTEGAESLIEYSRDCQPLLKAAVEAMTFHAPPELRRQCISTFLSVAFSPSFSSPILDVSWCTLLTNDYTYIQPFAFCSTCPCFGYTKPTQRTLSCQIVLGGAWELRLDSNREQSWTSANFGYTYVL